jgi:DNA-binding NarL/FixJ family response regulator
MSKQRLPRWRPPDPVTKLVEMTDAVATRVLLADYPGVGRSALAVLISESPGLELVAKASFPEELALALEEARPDVVVVDDRMLRDGAWTGRAADTRLIAMGVDDDPAYRARARRLGAEAWVPKDRADTLLPAVLRRARTVN